MELEIVMKKIERLTREMNELKNEMDKLKQNNTSNLNQNKFIYKYWNSKQNSILYENILRNVKACIKVSSECGGRVFGGFVRNVLAIEDYLHQNKVTGSYDIPQIGYKDVDLWFQTEKSAQLFIEKMGKKLSHIKDSDDKMDNTIVYNFKRQQYLLMGNVEDGDCIIDVVISKTLPVDDLNVNTLTYSSIDGFNSFGNDDTNDLINDIYHKKAKILLGYSRKDLGDVRWFWQSQRLLNLLNMGWTINNGDDNICLKDLIFDKPNKRKCEYVYQCGGQKCDNDVIVNENYCHQCICRPLIQNKISEKLKNDINNLIIIYYGDNLFISYKYGFILKYDGNFRLISVYDTVASTSRKATDKEKEIAIKEGILID